MQSLESEYKMEPLAKLKQGLVHIYTGNGKGKTTASLGLALRAIGQGFKVYMIQFLKGGAYTGELLSAEHHLPNLNIIQFGKGCPQTDTQLKISEFGGCPRGNTIKSDESCGDCRACFEIDNEEKTHARIALEHAKNILRKEPFDMLILDEINCAVDIGLLTAEEVLKMLDLKPETTELIMTGRGAPKELIEKADYVTEMVEHKHPFSKGIQSRRGIEY